MNRPAFPVPTPHSDEGLTIREYAAIHILAGLAHDYCHDTVSADDPTPSVQTTAAYATTLADALIKRLEAKKES
jgi:hypothetical protein